MRRLIYISTSRIDADEGMLSLIVEQAVARNAALDVTGMLWVSRHEFVQALEGEHDAVEATMRRIRLDTRHCDIAVICDRPVISRIFGSWTMMRADTSLACIQRMAFVIGYARQDGSAPARRTADMLLNL